MTAILSRPRGRQRLPAVLLVVVLLLIGLALGLAASLIRGDVYSSQAQLAWNPGVQAQLQTNYTAPDPTTFDREVADQQDVILSDTVVGKVVTQLHMTATDIRDGLSVSTTAGRSQILITGTASTPVAAQRLARAATDAYVDTLRDQNAAALKQQIAALQPVIAQLQEQIASARSATESGAVADDIAQLRGEVAQYTVASANVPVEAAVQREAELPTAPSSLSPVVSAAIGAAAGVILAICILALLAARSREIGASTPAGRPLVRARPAEGSKEAAMNRSNADGGPELSPRPDGDGFFEPPAATD